MEKEREKEELQILEERRRERGGKERLKMILSSLLNGVDLSILRGFFHFPHINYLLSHLSGSRESESSLPHAIL